MPKLPFTPHQTDAIRAECGNLLISAAAGSGKTAVLTERVVRLLTGDDPISADQLVIVTFTVAAAEEMRRRISDRLAELIVADPGNSQLTSQQLAIQNARISTIHSLCSGLIRDHFQTLGLSPDCKIAEPGQVTALEQEAAQEVLEEAYAAEDEDFLALAAATVTKDDRKLVGLLLSLYRYTRSFAFPDRFLSSAADLFHIERPQDHPWIRQIVDHVREVLNHCIALTRKSLVMIEAEPTIAEKYESAFQADLAAFRTGVTLLDGDPNEAFRFIAGIERVSLKAVRNPVDPALVEQLKERRNFVHSLRENLCKRYLFSTVEGLTEDLETLKPQADALFSLVRSLSARLKEKKRAANWMDYNDLEHYALALLAEETPEGLRRTPLCESLSREIAEIMVDECQDINEIQNTLFTLLSRNETNLFMVGDVKQSIYRFRQARPNLFVDKKKRFPAYSQTHRPGDPAVITLDSNFRSRREICGFVNFLFSSLMSEQIGEITYDENEYLIPGRPDMEETEPAVPPSLLVVNADPDDPRSQREIEAAFLADRIKEMVADGFPVHDRGVVRPCRYGDFAILLRSKKETLSIYSRVLEERGVPCYAERTEPCLKSYEVTVAINLLRIIDNPLLDVPLLSVLTSPLFGFSPTRLAQIRIADRKLPLYRALLQRAAEGDEVCAGFAETLGNFRQKAALLPVHTLLQEVYDQTDFLALSAAFGNGHHCRTNLRLLLGYAEGYSQFGSDLSGFLRYVDRQIETGNDIKSSGSALSHTDQVQILSIHASKGLEFPICFVADCAHVFNKKDLNQAFYQVHPSWGYATRIVRPETLQIYSNLPYEAIRLKNELEFLSEEMRILYVALTRAKEKLFMVITLENAEKKLKSMVQGLVNGDRVTPFEVYQGSSYAHWLITGCLRHPDADDLRQMLGVDDLSPNDASFPLEITVHTPPGMETQTEETANPEPILPRRDWCDALKRRFSFTYPYQALTNIPAKISVTALAKKQLAAVPVLTQRPAFLLQEKVTPAERGTLLHRFMELADFSAAADDLEGEIGRLVENAYFTAKEAEYLDLGQIRRFLSSPLYARIAAGRVIREYKFDFFLPASAVDPDLPPTLAETPVFLQGIADCLLFEPEGITLIDYKTDRVSHPDQLAARYAQQMKLYRTAIAAAFDLPIRQTLLYSLTLGQEIEIP